MKEAEKEKDREIVNRNESSHMLLFATNYGFGFFCFRQLISTPIPFHIIIVLLLGV